MSINNLIVYKLNSGAILVKLKLKIAGKLYVYFMARQCDVVQMKMNKIRKSTTNFNDTRIFYYLHHKITPNKNTKIFEKHHLTFFPVS